jgi:hypothetical protein
MPNPDQINPDQISPDQIHAAAAKSRVPNSPAPRSRQRLAAMHRFGVLVPSTNTTIETE